MERFEARLTKALEVAVGVCLLAILVVVVVLVGLRYVFNTSITGANELIVILFVYSTAIGAALGLAKGDHLSIEFVVEKLPGKSRTAVTWLKLVLLAIIQGIALYYSAQWIQVTGHYLMPSTGLPRWVAQLSIPLSCALGLCFTVMQGVRLWCSEPDDRSE